MNSAGITAVDGGKQALVTETFDICDRQGYNT